MSTRILVVDDSATIRKVVSTILERHGFSTLAAADGQAALELLSAAFDAAEKVDLVLLDFVMPRMNGFQFCRALRADEHLAATPVVLMSAKSDKIRDQFVQQTGAVDAISKPFDAQALVALIEHALMRVRAGRTPPSAAALVAAGSEDDGDGDEGGLVESSHPVSGIEASAKAARTAADFATRIARVVRMALAGHPAVALPEAADLGPMLAERTPPETMAELITLAQSLDFGPGQLALVGDLAIVPVGAVLQLLQVECQTGLLTVTNGTSEITIGLEGGLIAFVQSKGAGDEFRLGRFFVEEGLVTPEEIDALLSPLSAPAPSEGRPSMLSSSGLLQDARRARPRLGDVLLESGRITELQLREALARQSSELIYEVLRWASGRFEMRRVESPPSTTKLGLPVAHVVMEGVRRVDEWRLIESKLGSFDAVLQRDAVAIDALGSDRIARAERVVLDAVDGDRTVREIIAASHMSSFDACKILFQFLEARLVRRRAA